MCCCNGLVQYSTALCIFLPLPPSCWSRGSSDPMFLPFPRLTQPSFVSPDHRVLSTLSQGYCLPSAPPEQAGAPHCPSHPPPRWLLLGSNGRFPAVSGLPFETSCTLSAGVHPDPRSAHCIPIRVPFVCLVTKRPHLDFPPAQPPQPSSSHSPFGSRLKPVGEPGTPPPVFCAAPHRKQCPYNPDHTHPNGTAFPSGFFRDLREH